MAPVAAKSAAARKPPAKRKKAGDAGDKGGMAAASPNETAATARPRRSSRRDAAAAAAAAAIAPSLPEVPTEKLSIRISQPQEDETVASVARSRELTDSPSAQLAGAVPRQSSPPVLLLQPRQSPLPTPVHSAFTSPSPSAAAQPRTPSPPGSPSRSPASRPRSRSRLRSPHTRRSPSQRLSSPSSSPSSSRRSRRSSLPLHSPSSSTYSRQPTSPPHTNGTSSRRRPNGVADVVGINAAATTTTTTTPKTPSRPHYRAVLAMRGHTGPIAQVRISPDGRWIASASADGTARIWDAATGAHLSTLVGHMAGLSCVAWSPDSNTLATGSDDKSIRLWDRVTAEPAHATGGAAESGDGEETPVDVLSYAPTTEDADDPNDALLGGGNGGAVRGTRLPLLGHHNYVYCLAFSPKGNMLASGSYDEAVFLWDVRAGRLMRSLPAHSDPVSGIDFCCDGTLVVSCSTDGLIRIWDTATGQCLRTLLLLNEDNPAVANVCFSPNGRYVLAFNLDSCIRLWDYVAQPSVVKKTYQGHRNTGFSIGGCFGVLEDDDNTYPPFVAAASEDGDVVLWDVGTKAVVQRLRGAHRGGVCFWVDVCGATMVSCGQDGWINVYRHEGRPAERKDEVTTGEDAVMDDVPEHGLPGIDIDIDDDDEVIGVAMDLMDG